MSSKVHVVMTKLIKPIQANPEEHLMSHISMYTHGYSIHITMTTYVKGRVMLLVKNTCIIVHQDTSWSGTFLAEWQACATSPMLPFAEHRTSDSPCCVKKIWGVALSFFTPLYRATYRTTFSPILHLEHVVACFDTVYGYDMCTYQGWYVFFRILWFWTSCWINISSMARLLGFWDSGFMDSKIFCHLHVQVIQVWCERCRT